jgi:regulator of replication initiation timing
MNEEFINSYIETMNKKLNEIISNEVMALSRLAIAEKVVKAYVEENANLKIELEKLQPSILDKKKIKEDF